MPIDQCVQQSNGKCAWLEIIVALPVRPTPFTRRALASLPGLVPLLFLGHAYEDGGLGGTVPYVITLLLNVSYVLCPTLLAWILVFGAFVFYIAEGRYPS
jgi:hypothetical protein